MLLYHEIEENLLILRKTLEINKLELAKLPEGTMISMKNHKKIIRLHSVRKKDKYVRKVINNNQSLQKLLCRKKYLLTENKLIIENIALLEKTLEKVHDISPHKLIGSMSPCYSALPEAYFLTSSLDSSWSCDTKKCNASDNFSKAASLESTYEKYEGFPERKTHQTSFGLFVRSKSEQIIAEMLHKHNIRFRYEAILHIGDKQFAPDFTIRLSDGRLIYWEHFGLMTKSGYLQAHDYKLNQYRKADIVPWKNFIATYDDENGNISSILIEGLIRGLLLY